MDLLQQFSQYLLSQKQPPSKSTIKNYKADIGQFVRWWESYFKANFNPGGVTPQIIDLYKQAKTVIVNIGPSSSLRAQRSNLGDRHVPLGGTRDDEEKDSHVSPRTMERHMSSLRKFFQFLKLESHIRVNPFEEQKQSETNKSANDPWRLKSFKDYLYVYNASTLTIKNYIIDTRQFFDWAKKVTNVEDAWKESEKNLFDKIDSFLIEEYKNRLLSSGMAATSVNRKLSSLRRYLRWAQEEGLISTKKSAFADLVRQTSSRNDWTDTLKSTIPKKSNLVNKQFRGMDLPGVEPGRLGVSIQPSEPAKPMPTSTLADSDSTGQYSKFPPIRLSQKVAKGLNIVFDSLIADPLAAVVGKVRPRRIFTEIRNTKSEIRNKFKLSNYQINGKWKMENGKSLLTPNIKKEIYAPLSISTKYFPLHKKVWHHVRHTRPQWYRKYHSYPVTHYFHFAILIIFMSALGVAYYRSFVEGPQQQNPALAAPATPLKILSFQGRLTDDQDNPITADTRLRFIIYSDQTASGAARLWEETRSIAADTDGIFSVLLGADAAGANAALCNGGDPPTSSANTACGIPQSLFRDNASLWLGISVERSSELTPRQQLAAVAYATNAEVLQGLPPITDSGVTTNTNAVLALNSSGVVAIGGSATTTFQTTSGQFTITGQPVYIQTNAGSGGNIVFAPDGLGKIEARKPIRNDSTTGNPMGDGGISAAGAVEIDDKFYVIATESAVAAFLVNNNTTGGDIFTASSSATTRFVINNDGNVGIGDRTPDAFLEVLGTTEQLRLTYTDGTVDSRFTVDASGNLTIDNTGTKTVVADDLQVTGNDILDSAAATRITLGATTTLTNTTTTLSGTSTLTASSLATFTSAATLGISATTLNLGNGSAATIGTTTNANLSLSPNGTGDIRLVNDADTDIIMPNFTSNGGPLYTNGSGVVAQATAGTSSQCLLGGTAPTFGSCATGVTTSPFWNQTDGALYPNNSTVDLLVGGQATTSAKFAVLNIDSGTPTASVSSGLSGDGAFLTATGVLGTANQKTLTLGNSTTGDIAFAPDGTTAMYLTTAGRLGIGTTAPGAALEVKGATPSIYVNATSIGNGSLRIQSSGTTRAIFGLSGVVEGDTSVDAAVFAETGGQIRFYTDGSAVEVMTLGTTGNLTLTGSTITASSLSTLTTAATLGISATTLNLGNGSAATIGTTTNANLSLSPNGTGDIRLVNDADTDIIMPNFTSNGGPLYTNGSGVVAQATAGTSSQCLLGGTTPTFGSCGTGETIDVFWNQTNGALYPNNSTVDLLIGAQATTSAKFAVLNINLGTPTASVSSGLSGTSAFLTAAGTLATQNMMSLALGNSTTGNVIINPGGNVGVGTDSPASGNKLHVEGQCVTGNTKLKRRRRKKNGKLTDEYEDVEIKDIKEGDEVLTLDEKTGKFVPQIVEKLMDMGKQEVFELITRSGFSIRTTDNHPYLTIEKGDRVHKKPQRLTVFEVDQSMRVEDKTSDTILAIANIESSFITKLDKKQKQIIFKEYSQKNRSKKFGFEIFAKMIIAAIVKSEFTVTDLVIDIEYDKHEMEIAAIIRKKYPQIGISFRSIGKHSPAHLAAYEAHIRRYNSKKAKKEETLARSNLQGFRAAELLHPEFTGIRSPHGLFLNQKYTTKWVKVKYLKPGMTIATTSGWEKISGIIHRGREQTYDIQVANTHNFVGNNIVAHNTYISGNVGIGDTTPDAKLEVLATTEQLRLTHTDGTVDSRFTVDASGNLTIDNTGTKTVVADDLQVTGNDILDSAAATRITLGATTTLTNTTTTLSGTSTLTASSLATFTSAATLGISATTLNLGGGSAATIGTTSNANLSLSPNGTGDIRLVNDADTDIIMPGFNANNNVLYATVTTGVLVGASTSTTDLCLVSGASAPSWTTCPGGSSDIDTFWNQTNGALYPNNSTVDLLIGAQATTSAKFAVLNINLGTPTASVSSGLNGNGAFLTATGNLATEKMQTLSIGGSTTGNITIDSGSSSITLSDPTTISGNTTITGDLAVNGATSADITSTTTTASLFDATVTTLNIGAAATTWDIGAGTGTGTVNNTTLVITGLIDANGSGTHDIAGTLNLSGAGGLTFGTTGPITLAGGVISDSVDEVDISDDLAVSGVIQGGGTGATTHNRLGTATAGGANIGDSNDLLISDSLEVDGTLYADGALISPLTNIESGLFRRVAGVLSPTNIIDDLIIGGTATNSANPSLFHAYGNGPFAGTNPVASIGGKTSYAALVVDNRNATLGDIFAASSSGIPQFTIRNNGAVGMGTTLPSARVDIQGVGTQLRLGYDGSNSTTLNTDSSGNLTINATGTKSIIADDLQISGNDILDSAAATRITLGATTTLTNTTTTLSGTSTLTASSLATFTSAATLGMASTTTLNLGANATLTSSATALNLQSDGTVDVNLAGGSGATGCTIANSTGNLTCSGTLQGTGATLTGLTEGSVVFAGSGGALSQDNSNFFWDDTNNELGIGTTDPLAALDVRGTLGTLPAASISAQSSFAALVVDNKGLGDIFTASSSGLNRFVVTQGGNVGVGITTPNNRIQVADLINFPNSDFGTFLGYQAGNVTTGDNNVFVGYQAGLLNTTGANNSAFGAFALDANTTSNNSAFGYNVLGANSTGTNNSAFGAFALDANTTANDNSAFGHNALGVNSTGAQNSAFGAFALDANTTSNNSAFGWNALGSNSTGVQNSAFGSRALDSASTVSDNSAFGYNAMTGTIGGQNSAFGSLALDSTTSTAAVDNVAFGYSAGTAVTTGTQNVLLGSLAGDSLTTGSNNIIIGYDTDTPAVGTSNFLNIGNTIFGDISNKYIGINTGTTNTSFLATLDVRGSLGTIPAASISAQSSFAALVVDNKGLGDIFTASSSGLNRFVITQNGNVGVGTTTPDALLDIDSTSTSGSDFLITNTGIYTGTGIFTLTANSMTSGTGIQLTANGLTSGVGQAINSSATAFTGDLLALTLSGSNAANTGNLLDLTNSGTLNTNTSLYLKHYATGTNNLALRVDDVSGDTSPFVIAGDGTVGIGTATPNTTTGFTTTAFEVADDNGSHSDFLYRVGGGGFPVFFLAVSNGTAAAPTGPVSNGRVMGEMRFQGHDGTDFISEGARIQAVVDGTAASNDMPGRLGFLTTLDGSSSPTLRMTINNAGLVSIGNDTTPDASLEIINDGSGDSFLVADTNDGDTTPFVITSNGSVGIRDPAPGAPLAVNGNIQGSQFVDYDNTTYFLDPAATTNSLIVNGSVGIGTTSPLGTFDLRANLQGATGGITPVATISGKTSFAAMVVDNSGVGDIFTASASGTTRFVIANNGNVGIGISYLQEDELDDVETFESGVGDWTDTDPSGCWTRDSGGTSSVNTGPSSGADGTTWYMYTETSSGVCNGADDDSIEYTLSETSAGYVSFYYHMFGATMGTLSLGAWDGSSWSTIWSRTGQQEQTDETDAYTYVASGTEFPSDTQKIRFHYTGATSFTGDAAIDEITVYLSPGVTTVTPYDKLHVVGDTRIQSNGTAWNVKTGLYDGLKFSVGSQDSIPNGVTFKDDGTKMYVVGRSNIGDLGEKVYQYSLSTPWVVSTATYDSVLLDISGQEAFPQAVVFGASGTKMYVVGSTNDTVYQYSLTSAWDLSTASYDSISFSVAAQETVPLGLAIKPDGTKLYVVGSANDTVYQYSLTTPWNISTNKYDSVSFSVTTQENNPQEVVFKSDGTKMYILGQTNNTVYQYSLSTPWVVSTALYDGVSFSVASQESATTGFAFKPDGAKIYALGTTNDTVYQYSVNASGNLLVYGKIGIGTTAIAADYALDVVGAVRFSSNTSTDDLLKTTTADFTVSGYKSSSVSAASDQIAFSPGTTGAVVSTGPSTTAGCTTGCFSFERPDKKFITIIGGSATTTNIYDPATNAFTAGPALTGAAAAGTHSFPRPDGKMLVIHGNSLTTTSIYDPATNAFTAGPALTTAVSTGAHSFQRPDGKFVIIAGAPGGIPIVNTNIYDPSTNAFTAGSNLTATAGVGAHSFQKPDGKFVVILGNTTTTTNIYDPATNSFSAGPNISTTLGQGASSFQRPDGKFIIISGRSIVNTTLYDPTTNVMSAGPNLTTTAGTGSGNTYAMQRPNGSYTVVLGNGTTTNNYDPTTNAFSAGTALGATSGGHAFQRPDGKYIALRGNGFSTSDIFDAGWNSQGFWESEDLNLTNKISSSSAFFWKATNGGSTNPSRLDQKNIVFQVKTADGLLRLGGAQYASMSASGDFLPQLATQSANFAKVRIAFKIPIPAIPLGMGQTGESSTWNASPTTVYFRNFQRPTVYEFGITNPIAGRGGLAARSQPWATGSAQLFQLDTTNDNQLRLTLDKNANDNTTNKGTQISQGPRLSQSESQNLGSIALQLPDGQFLVVHGANGVNTKTSIYNPAANDFTAGPTMATAAGGAANAFQRPDGKFVLMTNQTTTTNIYDPATNSFTIGPTSTTAIARGSNTLQLPNGKFLIQMQGTTTNIYDPTSNAFTAGPSLPNTFGRSAIKRADGRYIIIPGAASSTYIYDPAINSFYTGPNLTTAAGAGLPVPTFQRPDGNFVVVLSNGLLTNIYDPVANSFSAGPNVTTTFFYNALQRPDGKYLLVSDSRITTNIYDPAINSFYTGPNFTTAAVSGVDNPTFQLPDGKFVRLFHTGATNIIDLGWALSGSYISEIIYSGNLGANTVLTWNQGNSLGKITAFFKSAGTPEGLGAAEWKAVPYNGATVGTNGNSYAQIRFDLSTTLSHPSFNKNVWGQAETGNATIYYRPLNTPILNSYSLTNRPNGGSVFTIDSAGSTKFRFNTDGNAYTADGGAWFAGGADIAEYYSSREALEAGDIVAIRSDNQVGDTHVTKSIEPYQKNIIGIVSTKPGFVAGAYTQDSFPIALVGRVPVKVSLENGVIKPGDPLTSSPIPGVAMKSTKPGYIIGKALEPFDLSSCHPTNVILSKAKDLDSSATPQNDTTRCQGTVMVFVKPEYYDPTPAILTTIEGLKDFVITRASDTASLIHDSRFMIQDSAGQLVQRAEVLSGAVIGNLRAGAIEAKQLTIDNLQLTTEGFTISGESLRDYIAGIVEEIVGQMSNVNGHMLVSPIAEVDIVRTNVISPLASDTVTLNGRLVIARNEAISEIATSSSTPRDDVLLEVQGSASISGQLATNQLTANDATISGTLYANRIKAGQIEGLDALINQKTASNEAVVGDSGKAGEANSSSTTTLAENLPFVNSQDGSGPEGNRTPGIRLDESIPNQSGPTPNLSYQDSIDISSYSGLLAYNPSFGSGLSITADFGQFNQGLIALGPTSLTTLSVVDQLSIGGNLILADSSINVFGTDLELQPLRQGGISFLSGLVRIDTDGNLTTEGDITIKGKLTTSLISPIPNSDLVIHLEGTDGNTPEVCRRRNTTSGVEEEVPCSSSLVVQNASGSGVFTLDQQGNVVASGSGNFNDILARTFNIVRGAQADTSMTETIATASAGTATIIQGETERTIITPYVTEKSLIYFTPTTDTQGLNPYLARQTVADPITETRASFTIQIPRRTNKDITVNWWIVN